MACTLLAASTGLTLAVGMAPTADADLTSTDYTVARQEGIYEGLGYTTRCAGLLAVLTGVGSMKRIHNTLRNAATRRHLHLLLARPRPNRRGLLPVNLRRPRSAHHNTIGASSLQSALARLKPLLHIPVEFGSILRAELQPVLR